MPPKLPPQALETAHEKLKGSLFCDLILMYVCMTVIFQAFRARVSRMEWKTFELAGANGNLMEGIVLPHKFENRLTNIMEGKVRLPVRS